MHSRDIDKVIQGYTVYSRDIDKVIQGYTVHSRDIYGVIRAYLFKNYKPSNDVLFAQKYYSNCTPLSDGIL